MIRKIKSLQNHQGFMKYFKNTSWLFIDKIFRIILSAIVGIWTARYLGPENFGILSFAISFVGLFGAFAKLGLDGIITRNIVRNPNDSNKILGTSLVLRIIGTLILLLFVFVSLQFIDVTTDEKYIVMILAFGQLFMSFELINCYFQAKVKGKYSAIVNSTGITILSIAIICFILLELPLIYFAFSVIIEQIVRSIIFYILYSKLKKEEDNNFQPIKSLTFRFNIAKELLKDSWPLILAGIAIAINLRIDQIMIKEFLGNEQVGLYAAAVKIADVLVILPHVIKSSIYPSFINAHKKDHSFFLERISYGYKVLFYISLILAITMFLSANFIINTLFGEEYKDAVPVLQLASITILFASINANCLFSTEIILRLFTSLIAVGS